MKNQICVSSYSVRQLLGPIHVEYRGPDGKMASISWGEPAPDPLDLLDFPAMVREKLGLRAVEICQFHVPDRAPSYVSRLKRRLDDAEVELINMPIDVGNISDPDLENREEDLDRIEEWIQVAAALGSKMARVNASSALGGAVAPIEVTIESYRRLAAAAESVGLQLVVENHGGITADPEVIVRLVEAVGPTHLKTCVDIGNFEPLMSAGMARMQGREVPAVDPEPVYGSIARIAPYAAIVHAKTHEFDESGRPKLLDVVRALRIIRDTGFTGPISVEYEGTVGDPWTNTARTKALVEEAFGDN